MTKQVNLKLSDKLFALATAHAEVYGFMNLQDFIRDAMREAIYDRMEIRPEYAEYVLNSPETNTFLSEEESKKVMEELFGRADKAEHELHLQPHTKEKNQKNARTVGDKPQKKGKRSYVKKKH
jgi:hypothetical protein